MKVLTPRQEEILSFIKAFIEEHKFPPTIRNISANFRISVKGAYDHVKALEKKQYIRCNENCSRGIEIIEKEQERKHDPETVKIPILGNVAAGVPLFSEENYDGSVVVHTDFLKKGNYFALRVQGDSMSGAGIMDGDIAIFIQQNTAVNGDIVVAMVDDAFTLKRFFREKQRIKLKAENPAYHPIYTQNVKVLGKLSCVIRKYE